MIFGKSLPSLDRKNQSKGISRWRQMSLGGESEERVEKVEEESADSLQGWSTGEGEYVRLIKSSRDKSEPSSSSSKPQESLQQVSSKIASKEEDIEAETTFVTNAAPGKYMRPASLEKVLPIRPEVRKPSYDHNNVRTALGPGTLIDGKFSFDSPVRIDGDLSGEVTSTSALIVGEEANVSADIKVGSLIVYGKVTGNVEVRDLVEIRAGGSIEADISAERIVMEQGSLFNGYCTMS